MQVINKSLTFALTEQSGRSSVRLEYTSGGRVVAGSNPVTPTQYPRNYSDNQMGCEVFDFSAGTKTGRLFLNIRSLFKSGTLMFKAGTLFDLHCGWGRWRLYRSVLLFTLSLLKILVWAETVL